MENNRKNSSNSFIDRIKYIKNIQIYIIILVFSILLLIYLGSEANGFSNTSKMTCEEVRLSRTLSSIKNVGEVTTMITYETSQSTSVFASDEVINNNVKGVVVVAEGASDIRVKLELIKAVCFALNINASQVEIFEMK